LEYGRKRGGPRVANVTAAAKSQANILSMVVIGRRYHDSSIGYPLTRTCALVV
jgi:hypothetical protein